ARSDQILAGAVGRFIGHVEQRLGQAAQSTLGIEQAEPAQADEELAPGATEAGPALAQDGIGQPRDAGDAATGLAEAVRCVGGNRPVADRMLAVVAAGQANTEAGHPERVPAGFAAILEGAQDAELGYEAEPGMARRATVLF